MHCHLIILLDRHHIWRNDILLTHLGVEHEHAEFGVVDSLGLDVGGVAKVGGILLIAHIVIGGDGDGGLDTRMHFDRIGRRLRRGNRLGGGGRFQFALAILRPSPKCDQQHREEHRDQSYVMATTEMHLDKLRSTIRVCVRLLR